MSTRSVDTIVVIAGPAGVNLNPYTNVLSSRQVGALLFRGMCGVDGSGTPIPDLAVEVPTKDNGGISADGKLVTYHIDPAAKWADGKPLTAADVVFTWNLIAKGSLTDDPRGARNVAGVNALDDYTVQLTLAQPDAPFAWHFVPYVLPQHLLADSKDLLSDDFWVHPVGSRGRRVKKNVKAAQVDLVDTAGLLPTLRVVFADTDAGAQKVWDSEYRCVWLSPPVGPTGAEKSDTVPGSRWQAFVMNPSKGHPTADPGVREAFSAVATLTAAPGSTGPFGAPLVRQRASDAEAELALDREGWKPRSDGRRAKGGTSLTLSVMFNPVSAAEGDRIEYDIGKALKRFGGVLEPHATFEYTDYTGAGRLVLGNFDVALVDFPMGVPCGWAWPFDSRDIPSETNPAGLNVARISDPELDAAARAMRAAGSPAELRRALNVAWVRLEAMHFVLWDVRFDETVLYKGVDGVAAEPIEESALRSADGWRVTGTGSGD